MKINKRSISILSLVAFLFLGMSGLQAQQEKRDFKQRGDQTSVLNEVQKEQMKEARIAFAKATIDLKNELGELHAKQRTLFSAEKPNMKEIYANADKISELKNQIKKEEIGMKLDIRSFLTEEQQMKMAKHSKHRKGVMRDKKGQMGQANRAEMGRAKQGMRKGDRGEQQGKKGYGIKQKAGKQMGKDRNMLDLSDEQKAQMKEIRVAHLKETKELKNELEVIRLKQKHLMTAEKVDKNSIMDNIDRLSNIQNQLAKKQIDNKMEIREILTEDQLVLFMSHPKGKKGFAKRHKRMN
ncbi:periplasmic heavy metal sensor [Labilibaculum sp. DW002]|uniref:Periplasmic heavy metal sensor n=1 Tax=Paralabilibaculum antarcticum TaxID=2912572 RepID=A0ABT5VTI1_9BACT|nr:periplasmic heavy metal sensor [Labilibaculum sp. DW002]MDE5418622.1 periplasmic heavy metal sensor [Labilibaculum sp. DW002]